jgi:hypothetical protein
VNPEHVEALKKAVGDAEKVKAVTSDVEITAILDDFSTKHSGEGSERNEWAVVKISVDAGQFETDAMLAMFIRMCNGMPLSFVVESHSQGRPTFTGEMAIKEVAFKVTGKPPVQKASFDLTIPAEAIEPNWSKFRRATRRSGATIKFTRIQRDLFEGDGKSKTKTDKEKDN